MLCTWLETFLGGAENMYRDNGGDMDKIREALGGIEWKPDLPEVRDARDFAEKILAGSLVRSTTRQEGKGVWHGGEGEAPAGK